MSKERNISLDLLKIILAIFVVGLHCGFLKDIDFSLKVLTVNGVFRIAVPILFV